MKVCMQDCSKIKRKGVVESTDGSRAKVRIVRTSACDTCSASDHCSSVESKNLIVEVANRAPFDLTVGDNVIVGMTPHLGHKAVFIGFIAPLLLLIATLTIVSMVSDNVATQSIVPIISICVYYVLLYANRSKINNQFKFELYKKLNESGY